jgi:hypothetical protein
VTAANEEENGEEADEGKKTYDYLLSMAILSLTLERVKQLQSDRDAKKQELDILEAKQPADCERLFLQKTTMTPVLSQTR